MENVYVNSAMLAMRHPIVLRLKQGMRNADGRPVKNSYLTLHDNVRTSSGYRINSDIMNKLVNYNSDLNQPGKAKVIPITLLFDVPELNLKPYFMCFDGTRVQTNVDAKTPFQRCKGNGIEANRMGMNGDMCRIKCPGPEKCFGMHKPTDKGGIRKECRLQGIFDFQLRGLENHMSGVVRYRTTGFNTASNLLGQMHYIKAMFGVLRGLPLELRMIENSVGTIGNQIFTFYSLILSAPGMNYVETLGEAALKERALREKYNISMVDVENIFAKSITGIEYEEEEQFDSEDTEPDPGEDIDYMAKAEAEKNNKQVQLELKQAEQTTAQSEARKAADAAEKIEDLKEPISLEPEPRKTRSKKAKTEVKTAEPKQEAAIESIDGEDEDGPPPDEYFPDETTKQEDDEVPF